MDNSGREENKAEVTTEELSEVGGAGKVISASENKSDFLVENVDCLDQVCSGFNSNEPSVNNENTELNFDVNCLSKVGQEVEAVSANEDAANSLMESEVYFEQSSTESSSNKRSVHDEDADFKGDVKCTFPPECLSRISHCENVKKCSTELICDPEAGESVCNSDTLNLSEYDRFQSDLLKSHTNDASCGQFAVGYSLVPPMFGSSCCPANETVNIESRKRNLEEMHDVDANMKRIKTVETTVTSERENSSSCDFIQLMKESHVVTRLDDMDALEEQTDKCSVDERIVGLLTQEPSMVTAETDRNTSEDNHSGSLLRDAENSLVDITQCIKNSYEKDRIPLENDGIGIDRLDTEKDVECHRTNASNDFCESLESNESTAREIVLEFPVPVFGSNETPARNFSTNEECTTNETHRDGDTKFIDKTSKLDSSAVLEHVDKAIEDVEQSLIENQASSKDAAFNVNFLASAVNCVSEDATEMTEVELDDENLEVESLKTELPQVNSSLGTREGEMSAAAVGDTDGRSQLSQKKSEIEAASLGEEKTFYKKENSENAEHTLVDKTHASLSTEEISKREATTVVDHNLDVETTADENRVSEGNLERCNEASVENEKEIDASRKERLDSEAVTGDKKESLYDPLDMDIVDGDTASGEESLNCDEEIVSKSKTHSRNKVLLPFPSFQGQKRRDWNDREYRHNRHVDEFSQRSNDYGPDFGNYRNFRDERDPWSNPNHPPPDWHGGDDCYPQSGPPVIPNFGPPMMRNGPDFGPPSGYGGPEYGPPSGPHFNPANGNVPSYDMPPPNYQPPPGYIPSVPQMPPPGYPGQQPPYVGPPQLPPGCGQWGQPNQWPPAMPSYGQPNQQYQEWCSWWQNYTTWYQSYMMGWTQPQSQTDAAHYQSQGSWSSMQQQHSDSTATTSSSVSDASYVAKSVPSKSKKNEPVTVKSTTSNCDSNVQYKPTVAKGPVMNVTAAPSSLTGPKLRFSLAGPLSATSLQKVTAMTALAKPSMEEGSSSKTLAAGAEKSDIEAESNLWVGNLPSGTTAIDVRTLVSKFGKVVKCKVGTMKSQKDAGLFALVTMETINDVAACIKMLHESYYKGQKILVKKLKQQ